MSGKNMAGIRAIQALREKGEMSAERLALELYEQSGSRGSIETYQRRFRGCFNADREQDVFAHWEVIAMMKITGIHDPLFYICETLGYERPQKLDPNDRAAILRNKLEAALSEAEALKQELDKLEQIPEQEKAVRFSRS